LMRILLDVDGVIGDLVGALCAELTAAGYPRDEEDITHYDFEKCLPPDEVVLMRDAMVRPGFCASIPWYAGARALTNALQDVGDLVVVTKTYRAGPTWAYERQRWAEAGGLFKIVHTGNKEYVDGDVLIEDSIENALSWKRDRRHATVVLVDRPWNRTVPYPLAPAGIYRATRWSHVMRIVRGDRHDQCELSNVRALA